MTGVSEAWLGIGDQRVEGSGPDIQGQGFNSRYSLRVFPGDSPVTMKPQVPSGCEAVGPDGSEREVVPVTQWPWTFWWSENCRAIWMRGLYLIHAMAQPHAFPIFPPSQGVPSERLQDADIIYWLISSTGPEGKQSLHVLLPLSQPVTIA